MSKLKLRAIKDGKDMNRYCGPSVVSALTDLTTGQAARLFRLMYGRTAIKGSSRREVLHALKECNIEYTRWTKPGVRLSRTYGPTLARWLKLSKEDRTAGRVFLIVAGWHWQLVSGRRYTCGRIRDIVSIRDKRVKRRARVADVWELTSDNVTMPKMDVSKPKPKKTSAYYHFRKLIRQYPEFGLFYEIERYGDGGPHDYYVSMSRELEDLAHQMEHELRDEHYCRDIDEALDRMERMVEFGKEYYPTLSK
jgi:hypothetical protein